MGEDTTRLRQEIEATREELARDVDAVAFKASPQRIVGDRVDAAKGRMTGIKERVMGSAQDATSTARGAVGESVGTARDRAGGTVEAAREMPGHVADDVRGRAQGNPMAAGLIAFGVGWLVSSLMPATQAEARIAEQGGQLAKEKGAPLLDQAKQEARHIGQEMGEQLKPAAQEAAASVKETAAHGAQQVKETGTAAAQQVKEETRSQAEQARAQHTSGGSGSSSGPYVETVDVTNNEVISPQTGRSTQ